MEKIIACLREKKRNKKISKLNNKDFSLITNNCVGGAIMHELNLRFNTPFVNLWLTTKDFIKFCKNLEYYISQELSFIKEKGIDYPIGVLNDIKVYFQHYKDEEDAKTTWERRKARINRSNMFILMIEKSDCTEEDLLRFDEIPYRNKVVLVYKKYSRIQSAVLIKGYEKDKEIGYNCTYYKGKYSLKKPIEAFNYVAWFNNGEKK